MKKLLSLLLIILFASHAFSQTTYKPSCFSNGYGWTITKIENNYDATYVYLNFYSYKKNYTIIFPSDFCIVDYDNPYSAKYYVKEFVGNSLNKEYNLSPFTDYDLVLKFERIPSSWKNISIFEPTTIDGRTSLYFKNITLNLPSSQRLYLDNFLLNGGIEVLAGAAHPLNTFRRATYNIDYGKARVVIYYNSYTLDLRLYTTGKYIDKIDVMYDDDYDDNFIWAFSGLSLLRNTINEQKNYDRDISDVERRIGKYISQMSGEELAAALLDLMILLN